jgi:hypothetical protein
MVMDLRRKIILAAVLLLVWIGLAIWQWGTWKEPTRTPLINVTGGAFATGQAKTNRSGLHVNLELLESARTEREATYMAPRNIFALPSSDGKLPVVNEAASQAVLPESSPAQTILEQAVAAEPSQYKYLGFLRLGEGRKKSKDIAVLSKNEEVVVGKVGDRVEDHLVLKDITSESVTIRDTGSRIDQTVPLSEELPPQQ